MFEPDLSRCIRGEVPPDSDDASDDSLVLVARSGDHDAFMELRRRHAKKLLPRIYRITRSWEDAEDVMQWSARLEMCQWRRETLDKESIWDEGRSTSLSRW
jgi:hypothetical protein